MITAPMGGHCEGSCKGGCSGDCKLDANAMINCGANVNCKGGCSVAYTAPKCEGAITPAKCSSDVNCQASCQGHANLTAMCTPPTATLQCSANASASVMALVKTVGTNFPALLEAVQVQGPLAVSAVGNLKTTGQAVVSNIGSQTGKALACATAGVSASSKAAASVNVSVMASASVSASAGGPSM
jgi:hypothetical protein